jgi:RNase adapter protein RapZ
MSSLIDTSQLHPAVLRGWVRNMVGAPVGGLTVVFESFAFKHGVPLDADYVFDVRVLPNPYYISELKRLTGRDAPVAAYLEKEPAVLEMLAQIRSFLERWLPAFEANEWLARQFAAEYTTLVRHRELDARE